MQNSLALCMAVENTPQELEKANKLAESLKPFVDAIHIFPNLLKDYDENYSTVRKLNFDQAKENWILWLDADDELQHPEKLSQLIKTAETNKIDGYFVKYNYAFDERGNCIDTHWKLQLVKNDGHAEWAGAIHEDLLQKRPARWVRTNEITRVHKTDSNRIQKSTERNLRILLREAEKNPKEPRIKFYLGRIFYANG